MMAPGCRWYWRGFCYTCLNRPQTLLHCYRLRHIFQVLVIVALEGFILETLMRMKLSCGKYADARSLARQAQMRLVQLHFCAK